MDSLMCDEELLDSPCVPESPWKAQHRDLLTSGSHISPEQEDFKDALGVYLEKEASYTPVHGYAECLRASMLVDPRLMAVNWMAQVRHRNQLASCTSSQYSESFRLPCSFVPVPWAVQSLLGDDIGCSQFIGPLHFSKPLRRKGSLSLSLSLFFHYPINGCARGGCVLCCRNLRVGW